MSIAFRVAVESDHPFIYNSWLRSFRNSSFSRAIPNEQYYSKQGALITYLLASGVTLLAVDPEDTNIIWGYVNTSGHKINYIYCKYLFRKMGIARQLVGAFNIQEPYTVTHMTNFTSGRMNIVFDPSLLARFYA